jgi:predicted amidohydrolase
VHLVWGTYERGPERGVVYNSAVLAGPTGEILGVYRKTHLWDLEKLPDGRGDAGSVGRQGAGA